MRPEFICQCGFWYRYRNLFRSELEVNRLSRSISFMTYLPKKVILVFVSMVLKFFVNSSNCDCISYFAKANEIWCSWYQRRIFCILSRAFSRCVVVIAMDFFLNLFQFKRKLYSLAFGNIFIAFVITTRTEKLYFCNIKKTTTKNKQYSSSRKT